MATTPVPTALLMPGPLPIVGLEWSHDYITVRCPACNATYVLALPRVPKFAGTVHAKVSLLKSIWGACGHHPPEIAVCDGVAADAAAQ